MVKALGGFCMWTGMRKGDPLPSVNIESLVPWKSLGPQQTWMTGCPSGGTRPEAMARLGPEHRLVRRDEAETRNCFGRCSGSRI